jgi:phage recombination protein Bet
MEDTTTAKLVAGYGDTLATLKAYVPEGITETPEDYLALVSEKILGRDRQGKLRPFGDFMLFLYQCKRTGLDPLARQITPVFRNAKQPDGSFKEVMSIQTTIDGYRLIAERSGLYAGSDDAIYDAEDQAHPNKATVTVYKLNKQTGERMPVTATARWSEYVGTGPMWNKMPYLMIAKCAEALALRKAFPQELSGVYTREEMSVEIGEELDPKTQIETAIKRREENRVQVEAIDEVVITEQEANPENA